MLPVNHISLTLNREINSICNDLFKNTQISYFIYARFFEDGLHFCLPSNADWHKNFWDKDYQRKSHIRLKEGYNLWHAHDDFSSANYEAKNLFDIDNKFEIVEKGSGYYDIFGFGSAAGNEKINNFYINNLGFLKRFSCYFKSEARSLIKKCELEENLLFIEKSNSSHNDQRSDLSFLKNRIRRYLITHEKGQAYLSNREIEAVVFYVKGRTASETGVCLGIAEKTVEHYIASAKEKLGCKTKADLFDFMDKSGIVKQFSIIDI